MGGALGWADIIKDRQQGKSPAVLSARQLKRRHSRRRSARLSGGERNRVSSPRLLKEAAKVLLLESRGDHRPRRRNAARARRGACRFARRAVSRQPRSLGSRSLAPDAGLRGRQQGSHGSRATTGLRGRPARRLRTRRRQPHRIKYKKMCAEVKVRGRDRSKPGRQPDAKFHGRPQSYTPPPPFSSPLR